MSFFDELKRRNVFRVGIAYVVVGWLVTQVLEIVLESFGSPPWVMKTTLVLLAAGLPFALIFAWAFEMTPEGIKKEKDVDRSQSITHHTGRKLDFAIIAVLLIALGYFAYDKFVLSPDALQGAVAPAETVAADAETATGQADEKSVAVLPFVNMSEDASNEYFSDGISEEILNSLAKVKELKVAGRSSSFAFKGQNQDLRLIGETLGVNHILEGSVRKFGNQVRITAQLIQVDNGFHLWSESYDRELQNVFVIQDEIATAILKELKATLLDEELSAVTVARTDSQAYDLYLLARQRIYERTHLTIRSAAELLDEAIAIDPNYAPAYAQRGIAAMLLSETSYGDVPQAQALAQARLYLDKALELDQNLAEAWAGMGLYYNGPPPQALKGIPVLEKALAINPNLINASNWLTLTYWNVNRMTESMALLDSMAERDPLYKPGIGNRAFQMALMGRGDEARAHLDEIEAFMPGDPQLAGSRAWVDYEQGRMADGLERMQSALAMQGSDRTYRAGVNHGHYLTHQYEQVNDDHWSDFIVWSLFNLGRDEEATLIAAERAAAGVVGPLFAFLNATDQSDSLIEYFEERWPDLEAFQRDVPAHGFGYREMADIALAYRRAGRTDRYEQAMEVFDSTNRDSWDQGVRSSHLAIMHAAYHAMMGDTRQSLNWLAQAVDGGMIVSAKISKEFPYFRELDGHPEYEAIQTRMIEHLNNERAQLGLEPVST
jgi:TolB-like protein